MMKVIRYCPTENKGEPQLFRIPPRQTTYRVDIFVKLPGKDEADRRVIDVVDKMTIHDVHALAVEALCEIVRDGELVEDAYFEVWAA